MMFKNLIIVLFILFQLLSSAQMSTEKDLIDIETPEQINDYLNENKSNENKLITFSEIKHKTILANELFELSKGGVKTTKNEFNKTFYKVIKKSKKKHYRVSYIALDGKGLSSREMNLLQDKIIRLYNSGTPFDFLVKRYSIDENANRGGDTGWFTEEENDSTLKDIIINDKLGSSNIFTINIPSENQHYVVLRTHSPKNFSEIEVLKIVEPLN